MRSALHLVAVTLFSVLAGAAPVSASLVNDTAASNHDFLGAADGSATSDAAACTASQCGLADLKAAARAIAMSAGAKPAAASDHPSMVPDSVRKSPLSAASSTSANPNLEPALFALLAPNSDRSQLCIEEGNLLGMQATCRTTPANSNANYDCEHTDHRIGIKLACRINRDAPEPATPLLVVIALLGLAAARARRFGRKESPASL